MGGYTVSEGLENAIDAIDTVGQRTSEFLSTTTAPKAYDKLDAAIDDAESQVYAVTPETGYEELVVQDMEQVLETTQELADFLTLRSDRTVPDMVDLLYGDGTYDAMEDGMENFDFDALYEREQLRQSRYTTDVRRLDQKGILDLDAELETVQQIVDAYGDETGILPESFIYDAELNRREKNTRAYWDGAHNDAVISIETFTAMEDDDGYTVDASAVIPTLFHEAMGHGVHNHNSELIPYPPFTTRTTQKPMTQAHVEGFAQAREADAVTFLNEYADVLPVTDTGVELRTIRRDLSGVNHDAFRRLLIEQEKRGEIDETAVDRQYRLTTNDLPDSYREWLAEKEIKLVEQDNKMTLYTALKESAYTGGNVLMDRINHDTRSTHTITTGAWTPQVLPDVVDYFENNGDELNALLK